jgi:hypothetical protein
MIRVQGGLYLKPKTKCFIVVVVVLVVLSVAATSNISSQIKSGNPAEGSFRDSSKFIGEPPNNTSPNYTPPDLWPTGDY